MAMDPVSRCQCKMDPADRGVFERPPTAASQSAQCADCRAVMILANASYLSQGV